MNDTLRPLGEITDELEPLLFELVHNHKMQKHEVLALINQWIDVHYPGAIELYSEGGSPVFYYGPAEGLVRSKPARKKR